MKYHLILQNILFSLALISVLLYMFIAIRWSDSDYCLNWKIESQCHTFFFDSLTPQKK